MCCVVPPPALPPTGLQHSLLPARLLLGCAARLGKTSSALEQLSSRALQLVPHPCDPPWIIQGLPETQRKPTGAGFDAPVRDSGLPCPDVRCGQRRVNLFNCDISCSSLGRASGLTSLKVQHPAHFQVHQGSEIALQPKSSETTSLSRLLGHGKTSWQVFSSQKEYVEKEISPKLLGFVYAAHEEECLPWSLQAKSCSLQVHPHGWTLSMWKPSPRHQPRRVI
ncbi:uncharacterized protein LOC111925441 [Cyanistes caeruleus]|uniref:uncharacterized protein LOC111925441 n=1 Tax=Cyanistes caeruleus TaxID=156563 RepID=UPI000CDB7208|nr:uncharacterized protein LOC111925441 [Cyanistes caeruleus]